MHVVSSPPAIERFEKRQELAARDAKYIVDPFRVQGLNERIAAVEPLRGLVILLFFSHEFSL